jgi:error-prone DNA polymerase
MGHGQRVSLAGLVLVRQKPGSAKGVCFITLEDEDGVANLVIWPKLFEHYRALIMTARLMVVHGRVQTDGRVIHVVADRLEDRTARLDTLAQERLPATSVRGDHVTHPLPGQIQDMHQHPRNARVIPKSRDFH